MKDLTEAELIDMESRVVRLLNAFEDDDDLDNMSRFELTNAFDIARDRISAVARDTGRLCDHVRKTTKETPCAPSR